MTFAYIRKYIAVVVGSVWDPSIFLIASKLFKRKDRILFSELNMEGRIFAQAISLASYLKAEKVFYLAWLF